MSATHGNETNCRVHDTKKPIPTIAGSNRYALVEPFLVQTDQTGSNGKCCFPLDTPVGTVVSKQNLALIEPFILGQQSCSAPRSVDQPIPTVCADGAAALVEPFLTKYYGSAVGAQSINDPIDTISTKDRFLLVEPVVKGSEHTPGVCRLDILFRMLEPEELALGQGFKPGYKFAGKKGQRVKQIGNAVPYATAKAVIHAALA